MAAARSVTCGVVVSDRERVLLGHATRSPRWDIPKGMTEPGERLIETALRELREETGLAATAEALIDLGVHRYLPRKDLALFAWLPATLPDPATLACTSYFSLGGHSLPEFDRFGLFAWDEALAKVGQSLRPLLTLARDRLAAPS